MLQKCNPFQYHKALLIACGFENLYVWANIFTCYLSLAERDAMIMILQSLLFSRWKRVSGRLNVYPSKVHAGIGRIPKVSCRNIGRLRQVHTARWLAQTLSALCGSILFKCRGVHHELWTGENQGLGRSVLPGIGEPLHPYSNFNVRIKSRFSKSALLLFLF